MDCVLAVLISVSVERSSEDWTSEIAVGSSVGLVLVFVAPSVISRLLFSCEAGALTTLSGGDSSSIVDFSLLLFSRTEPVNTSVEDVAASPDFSDSAGTNFVELRRSKEQCADVRCLMSSSVNLLRSTGCCSEVTTDVLIRCGSEGLLSFACVVLVDNPKLGFILGSCCLLRGTFCSEPSKLESSAPPSSVFWTSAEDNPSVGLEHVSDDGTETGTAPVLLIWLGLSGETVLQVGCAPSSAFVLSEGSDTGVGSEGFSTGCMCVTGSFVV